MMVSTSFFSKRIQENILTQNYKKLSNVDLYRNTKSNYKEEEYVKIVLPAIRKFSSKELTDIIFNFERKYGIKSEKFYSLYKANYMKDTDDFINWAILYKKFFLKKNGR